MGFFNSLFGKGDSSSEDKAGVPWQVLNSPAQLDAIIKQSHKKPQAIFKHSTRCGISRMAFNQFERYYAIDAEALDIWYLDLLAYRSVSAAIADKTKVVHQSPQVILIRNGKAEYTESHHGITAEGLLQAVE